MTKKISPFEVAEKFIEENNEEFKCYVKELLNGFEIDSDTNFTGHHVHVTSIVKKYNFQYNTILEYIRRDLRKLYQFEEDEIEAIIFWVEDEANKKAHRKGKAKGIFVAIILIILFLIFCEWVTS